MKDGRLLLKDSHNNVVKRIMIHHPTHEKIEKEKERLEKHFDMKRFHIDESEFRFLQKKGK